uniref:NADPH oxidase activator 1 n=1 Tax=Lepisosteus oculatus TaxID=7918 RepID=W5M1B8_LEPOC|nr:PREDICTED: NADPH oxidase activator 1 isoform X1 [Lepisosteus oculatus]XP_015222316.1 PREDICTED: NADPH oxidase activator 1 isoform X1 [Lepisosteus oculatus]XP_015222317.1 PREDICTED: NADPH oxidase activator 1 isoform X1 [Lepisosteus oculatus]XP_015222318.1 PREDICTED: NADPH oxidase activator 1 isoform X1 [Lepisosteus oculatus]XP_015222319.1 PREDICTED: NADPH oxidase activator 1 isoform X1 [Lepisosteus oculatus]XP_015222320.1 PREDICTED: NADPH oxidase activator 1 isoform X1 [Lepisosteus oculatus]
MLYTELIRLWNEAAQAVDRRDWTAALCSLDKISEPTARTLFTAASVHLTLGHLEQALQALDQTIARDERLAVAFFQRAAVNVLTSRLEEALSDCALAHRNMRGNPVIEYRQLGLRYKLYSWQVLYNKAVVHSRLGQWDEAGDLLLTLTRERGGGRGANLDVALDRLSKQMVLDPLLVPEGEVFRPRRQDVEQLEQRDFLGKPKVISSVIPNDDFAGFEPLRLQKPGYYEPKADRAQESRYMCVHSTHAPQGPGELHVPQGEKVFVLGDGGVNGLVTVIYDGQKGLLPLSLLEPTSNRKADKNKIVPTGIPLPPGLPPPTCPQSRGSLAAPQPESPGRTNPPAVAPAPPSSRLTPPPHPGLTDADPRPEGSRDKKGLPAGGSADEPEPGSSVLVKVHYGYTVALRVPVQTPYRELQERIARKLGQPPAQLRLRHRELGSRVLTPLSGDAELQELLEATETGRTTLWCQLEDPLLGRPILYQVFALYDYTAQGPEDLEFSEGDTIDILSEVNEGWLEGHTAGKIGIFPRCFVYRDTDVASCSKENPAM